MTQQRLTHLAVLHCHQERVRNIDVDIQYLSRICDKNCRTDVYFWHILITDRQLALGTSSIRQNEHRHIL